MAEIFDFKKEFKQQYQPKPIPEIVQIPPINFILVPGAGDPNEPEGEYAAAVEIIYGLSYTIKMSYKNGNAPKDYFEYSVAPLEGLWWMKDEKMFDPERKNELVFISMIRQPDFVTPEFFAWVVNELARKKKNLDLSRAKLASLEEGWCVQMMHLGPYATEADSVEMMNNYIAGIGYADDFRDALPNGLIRHHHEIYLTDPRKCRPEKMRTVLRHPIKKRS